MKSFWEERYAQESYIYGEQPNMFIKQFIESQAPGRGLFPAEGEGRNAIFAAEKEWQVKAFDQSEFAFQKAIALAEKKGVTIDYKVKDILDYSFPEANMDAVFLNFVHLPEDLRAYLHQKAMDSLKIGGKIVLEAFSKAQLSLGSGGPKRADMLFSTELLQKDFNGLGIELLEELVVVLDEGLYHQGEASVIRFIGQKI